MTIELFIDYISQPSRAVLAFCLLNSIPVAVKEIRIAKLQVSHRLTKHLQEPFATINPMKRVPAIRDTENGLTLGESPAIMAYLSRKFQHFEQFDPAGSQLVLPRVEEYLHYHHSNTRKCALLLYSALFSKLYPVQQSTVPDEKAMRSEVEGILTFINGNYFKDS
jgi:glutathione S-transferase